MHEVTLELIKGVDRHLFGLKKLLSSPYFDGWGYGEVVPDGYGPSYSASTSSSERTISTCYRTKPTVKPSSRPTAYRQMPGPSSRSSSGATTTKLGAAAIEDRTLHGDLPTPIL
ncbi:hypothetical protein D9615_010368 [Tricholomella constricta]|uniref:Uncharacterized protein n=1 Tax=Tricholomella constricta TaxID=117010 RepID=A0A8H5GNI4_9AGAR|nr:hypothetical protein D9615_010368 [Tricholomella constricta]